jgi:hypothetical protein
MVAASYAQTGVPWVRAMARRVVGLKGFMGWDRAPNTSF